MDAAPSTLQSAREITQPSILQCQLKAYQLKGAYIASVTAPNLATHRCPTVVTKGAIIAGLRWLNNLYEQGINGILADEMGLGKTVQSIALLAHLAESQNIWGPFLVIAPASTLHNWQQEITKFVPAFKVSDSNIDSSNNVIYL